jgi:hypothetical protein
MPLLEVVNFENSEFKLKSNEFDSIRRKKITLKNKSSFSGRRLRQIVDVYELTVLLYLKSD